MHISGTTAVITGYETRVYAALYFLIGFNCIGNFVGEECLHMHRNPLYLPTSKYNICRVRFTVESRVRVGVGVGVGVKSNKLGSELE